MVKLLSARHILKGTRIFYLALSFVKLSFWHQAGWSFSEQPSYSSHLTLYPALWSASQWELPPPQAGASGPIAKGTINQWLCPRHAQHLHQRIAFLTKTTKWPSNVWSPTSTPSAQLHNCSPRVAMDPRGGAGCPCDCLGQCSSFQSRLLAFENHLGRL